MRWKAYPEYEDSGEKWLGEVPRGWSTGALKRFVDRHRPITYGIVQCGEDIPDGVPYIRPVDMTDEGGTHVESLRRTSQKIATAYKRSTVQSGDLVVSIGPSFGKVMIVTDMLSGANLTQGTARVAPAKGVLNRFLFWCLRSEGTHQVWEALVTGATFRALNLEPLSRTVVSIPTLSEQRVIAAFLDRETARIDTLIEKKERQIDLLLEKRTALISHAVTKGLDPNVKMKNSGIEWLGDVPEHWDVIPLKFALKPCGDAVKTGPFGSQLLSSEMASGTVKVYNQRNVLDSDFSRGENYISEHKYHELKAFTVFPGDVLVTTRGTIGHCALFPEDAELGILHPCLMRIQTNASVLLPDYLSMLIQDGGIVLLQLRLMSNATTIDVIYSDSLKSVRLPVPPVHEQKEILSWLEMVITRQESMLAKVELSIDMLREYRTALISAAVTGKIDVRKESRQ